VLQDNAADQPSCIHS